MTPYLIDLSTERCITGIKFCSLIVVIKSPLIRAHANSSISLFYPLSLPLLFWLLPLNRFYRGQSWRRCAPYLLFWPLPLNRPYWNWSWRRCAPCLLFWPLPLNGFYRERLLLLRKRWPV